VPSTLLIFVSTTFFTNTFYTPEHHDLHWLEGRKGFSQEHFFNH